MTGLRPPPRVAGNDWRSLTPAPLGTLEATATVSVVIPAHAASATLPAALAALSVQTYPEHLLEVIVVDDGSDPPVTLPDLRPPNTTVVSSGRSWGPAHARHVGATRAQGEVLHWLDADMLLHRDEVEAQLRWHHLVDYAVVLGTKTFVDVEGWRPDTSEVARAVRDGRPEALFEGRWTEPHAWVEEHIERTDGLTRNPTASYLVHVGASASVRRDVYLDSGGMDETLKLAEDVELGYRLAQQGALFVPDAGARSYHLGRSRLMRAQDEVNRYTRPFVTDRVADLRHWRTKGRTYSVPWVEVVVLVQDHTYEEVRHSVDGVLTGALSDLDVLLVGPWSRLTDVRRPLLEEPASDLWMVKAEYAGDRRVRFVDDLPDSSFPATFRLLLPAGWSPGPDTVRRLAREMGRKDRGLVSLLLPDGQLARLERTSAFRRAARITDDPALLDEVVHDVSQTWWFDAVEEGFTRRADEPPSPAPAERAEPGAGGQERPRRSARPHDAGATTAPAVAEDGAPGAGRTVRGLVDRVRRRRP